MNCRYHCDRHPELPIELWLAASSSSSYITLSYTNPTEHTQHFKFIEFTTSGNWFQITVAYFIKSLTGEMQHRSFVIFGTCRCCVGGMNMWYWPLLWLCWYCDSSWVFSGCSFLNSNLLYRHPLIHQNMCALSTNRTFCLGLICTLSTTYTFISCLRLPYLLNFPSFLKKAV